MIFDRHEEQCIKCACYIKNTDGEVRKIMDEWKMNCTNDRYCHQETPCDVFIKKWKYSGMGYSAAKRAQI